MFSGIVEEIGRVRSVTDVETGVRIAVEAERVCDALELGDSVAIEGVCQTVVARDATGFEVVAIATTLSRTTLGGLRPGRRVNLERALALGDRIGGHFVQGHVDDVGEVVAVEQHGDHRLVDVRLPAPVAEVTVLHGSIAVSGVSMTVNALPSWDVAQIAVIPYTWEHTTLAELSPGSRVNLEGDMLGRFVAHYLKRTVASGVNE